MHLMITQSLWAKTCRWFTSTKPFDVLETLTATVGQGVVWIATNFNLLMVHIHQNVELLSSGRRA